MLIIGIDYHPSFQQISFMDEETVECGERRLNHSEGEAAQAAVRRDADWRRRYVHLAMRRKKSIAKVAMARKLGVRLYWMWRNGWDDWKFVEFGSNAGKFGIRHGVKYSVA